MTDESLMISLVLHLHGIEIVGAMEGALAIAKPAIKVAALCGSLRKASCHRGLVRTGTFRTCLHTTVFVAICFHIDFVFHCLVSKTFSSMKCVSASFFFFKDYRK